jgi:RHS repeat-associated protein
MTNRRTPSPAVPVRKLFLISLTAILVARVSAHDVVWPENPLGTDPTQKMNLYWPGNVTPPGGTATLPTQRNSGFFSIQPVTGEDCVVVTNATVGGASTLIGIQPIPASGTAPKVDIVVRVLRAPANGSEEAKVIGEWHATGKNAAGANSALCDAVVPNPFAVTVLVRSSQTIAQQSNAACTADPISTSTGEVMESEIDLSLGGPLPLTFTRYYSSSLGSSAGYSALGLNWMHNFDDALLVTGSTAVVVLYPGKFVQFQQTGGTWQLSSTETANYQLISSGGTYQFADLPRRLIYTFSGSGALTRVQDRNGNALTITQGPAGPLSVSDGLGRTLTFTYNGTRLARVSTQTARSLQFTYTGNDLTAVTDPLGRTTSYAYVTSGSHTSLMASKTRPAGNKPVVHAFDASGAAVSETDSLGNVTTIAYNSPSSGVTTVTDPLKAVTQHTYAQSGNVASQTDSSGLSRAFTYDASNRVTSTTDRLGAKATMTYHVPSGLLSSITDPQGNTATLSYTAQTQGGFTWYNLTKATLPDSTSVTYAYDAQGNVNSVTDRAGKVWTYTYNSRGQLLTTTNAAAGVTTYTYNNDGTIASLKTPAGAVTTYTYDDEKRTTAIQNPDQTSRSFVWDAAGQLLSVTDERGKMSKWSYDQNGNLQSAADPLNQSANISYDSDDLPTSMADALGKVTRLGYDPVGNPTSVTNPAGEKTSQVYDQMRRLTSLLDPGGKGYRFSYDGEDRLTGLTDALGNSTSLLRDSLGRITRVTSPLGENFSATYDAMNRLTSKTNPLAQTTSYKYDNRDLLTSVSLPENISAGYTWGDLSLLTAITDPNGNIWKSVYDNMGRRTSRSDPLGRTISYTYDGRNRPTGFTTPEGSAQFTYDVVGNRTQLQYSDGQVVKYTYDDNDRPTGGAGVKIAYDASGGILNSNGLLITRDDAGRISAIAYAPGKTVTYKYDMRGLLGEVRDWTGAATAFVYDDAQRLVSVTRPNGLVTRYSYDKNGRIAGIGEMTGAGTLASVTLQRDAAGQVTSADRNLPQAPAVAAGVLPLSYDAAQQLSGASYDGVGRIKTGLQRNFTWNGASELTSYSGENGSGSFGYDAFGMRTSATAADGATQNYVVNYALGLPSLATVQAGGTDRRYYVYLPDGALLYAVEAADNAHHYYHFDEIGSTTFLTDDSGVVTDRYGITPYGEIVTSAGSTANPFTWLGEWGVMQEGASGLYYMRYRYYDSTTARFLSRDPVAQVDPREINPYQYAAANPLSNVDPIGMKSTRVGPAIEVVGRALNWVAKILDQRAACIADAIEQPYAAKALEVGEFLLDRAKWYLEMQATIHLDKWRDYLQSGEGWLDWEDWFVRANAKDLLASKLQCAGLGSEEVMLAEIASKTGWLRRISSTLRNVGNAATAVVVTVDTAKAVHRDVTNKAPVVITVTDGSATVLAGATNLVPVVAAVNLATGGEAQAVLGNAARAPNTIGYVAVTSLTGTRVNSQELDAIQKTMASSTFTNNLTVAGAEAYENDGGAFGALIYDVGFVNSCRGFWWYLRNGTK